MTDDELEKLARMIAARVTPAAEVLTEIGAETKAVLEQLKNERAAMPEVMAQADRIEALEATTRARLPRQPRPWHLKWWVKAPQSADRGGAAGQGPQGAQVPPGRGAAQGGGRRLRAGP